MIYVLNCHFCYSIIMANNLMRGNFKTLLKNFCLEGSVLGLKYFYLYPDPISRCFWAVTLMLLTTFACMLTMQLYIRFNESPTRITIENQYEQLTSLPYPAITICSPNQITVTAMEHLNKTLVDGNVTVDLNRVLPLLLGFYETIKTSSVDIALLKSFQDLVYENRYTLPEVMGLVPQSCDDFLKQCVFKQELRKCHQLFRPLLTKHGLCCVFNSPYHFKNKKKNEVDYDFKPYMATTLGMTGALQVVVDHDPVNALDHTVVQAGGIRVMLTDWTEFPADDETTLVIPNVEAFLLILGTYTYCSEEVASLPPSSRQCNFEHEHVLRYFIKYRNSDCDHVCNAETLRSKCGCVPMFLPRIRPHERVCDTTNIDCIVKVKVLSNKYDNVTECNCPRDCDSRKYTVEMNLGNLQALPHVVINPFENMSFNNSTTILNMFFPSSVYVKKKQETVMSLISLASNLGGVFGLCLGCSVVSVMEIVFYIVKAIRWYRRRANVSHLRHCNAH